MRQAVVNAFQSGEDEQIITYLSTAQTPEAFNKRKAQAAAASSAGRSMITQSAAVPEAPVSSNRSGGKTLGFIAAVCLSLLTLIIRRPGEPTLPGVPAEIPTGTKPPAAVVAGVSTFADPLILRTWSTGDIGQ
jgi:hypothetical protein